MKEKTWLKEQEDPYKMVNFLRERVTTRKAKLFACACFRHPKQPLKDWEVRIVEVGEQAADGLATDAEIQNAEDESVGSGDSGVAWVILTKDWWTAVEAARAAGEWEKEELQCDLVRDIFGNPFRPVTFSDSWRTDTALTLARQMYDSRDFGAMPILADALQDAGCEVEEILNHCRDAKQTHVRGCWVVDLVLGKA
jgi:hypothetical protein